MCSKRKLITWKRFAHVAGTSILIQRQLLTAFSFCYLETNLYLSWRRLAITRATTKERLSQLPFGLIILQTMVGVCSIMFCLQKAGHIGF